jgi:hypothetical protein
MFFMLSTTRYERIGKNNLGVLKYKVVICRIYYTVPAPKAGMCIGVPGVRSARCEIRYRQDHRVTVSIEFGPISARSGKLAEIREETHD